VKQPDQNGPKQEVKKNRELTLGESNQKFNLRKYLELMATGSMIDARNPIAFIIVRAPHDETGGKCELLDLWQKD
jgi:hypothetical protein